MNRFTVSFFVRTSIKDKDKKVKIKARISAGRGISQIADTKLLIKAADWKPEKPDNSDRKRLSGKAGFRGNVAENEDINSTLEKLKIHIDELMKEQLKKGDLPSDFLSVAIDKYYNPDKYEEKPVTLFSFIEDYIRKAEHRINPKTGKTISYKMIREYERTYFYLKEFSKEKESELNFNDIDLEFYDEFIRFMQSRETPVNKKKDVKQKVKLQKLAINTIGKKIQTLKIFLNDATERGFNTNLKYKSHKFVSVSEEAEHIYLNEQDLDKLYQHDFSDNERLERVRDLFIIGAWTGLRFSDLSALTAKNIHDGRFHVKQKKTGNPVIIPLHPNVKAILQKYGGKLPPVISNQKFNDYLREAAKAAKINSEVHKGITRGGKRISKKYEKHELISTHTARRSFATNLYKADFPSISIMAITGHRTESAFLKYIKVTPEEHAKKLENFWIERAEHLKIAR
ncbi:MAG: site-specific integrase [Bacteroidales bacterium]|nr:site-specific integrase [Bacteroidales bacterium]